MSPGAFRYRAARPDGTIVSGRLEAADATEAGDLLSSGGLLPISLSPAPPHRVRAAPRRELATLFQSIAGLFSAGVPLDKALLASRDVVGGRLGGVLEPAAKALRGGRSLSQALAEADCPVPPFVLGLVRAGERGGRLGDALHEVAEQLEAEAELAASLRHALAYPTLLAVAGTAAVAVIGSVVVPRFATMLSDLGQELPASTTVLLASSGLVRRFGPWAVFLIVVTLTAGVRWRATPRGRLTVDRWLLRVPIVGTVRLATATASFCRAMGALLGTGAPILEAIETGRQTLTDGEVAARLTRVKARVAGGEGLWQPLREEQAILPTALHVVAVGEGNGRLAAMLLKAADLAAGEAQRRIRTAVSLLEPTLIIAFGALVAWVAAALLQAVYAVRPGS